jgi:hypothetical protein
MKHKEFSQFLGGFIATPVEDVFLEYKSESRPFWFHLLASIEDFKLIWSCSDFKFYSLCRCHQIAEDGNSIHNHVHAVISSRVSLPTWKQRLFRNKIKLNKTTFKKILCGDHLAGVIRYLSCKTGLKNRTRGAGAIAKIAHTHFERKVDVKCWLHRRGKKCNEIRGDIERKMKIKLNVPLHDYENCKCPRGQIGINNRKEANRKRSAFYKSEKGLDWKEKIRKKKIVKDEIIRKILEIKNVKNELLGKELERLVNLL